MRSRTTRASYSTLIKRDQSVTSGCHLVSDAQSGEKLGLPCRFCCWIKPYLKPLCILTFQVREPIYSLYCSSLLKYSNSRLDPSRNVKGRWSKHRSSHTAARGQDIRRENTWIIQGKVSVLKRSEPQIKERIRSRKYIYICMYV